MVAVEIVEVVVRVVRNFVKRFATVSYLRFAIHSLITRSATVHSQTQRHPKCEERPRLRATGPTPRSLAHEITNMQHTNLRPDCPRSTRETPEHAQSAHAPKGPAHRYTSTCARLDTSPIPEHAWATGHATHYSIRVSRHSRRCVSLYPRTRNTNAHLHACPHEEGSMPGGPY